MGRLGPVGMLGMMLIMPQLGAWWSEFGAWAGQLAQPFKFVMEGVHWAGAQIGKAYSTITEGIDGALDWFSEAVGLGDKYTDLKSWMDTKMEGLQTKLGLETKTGLEYQKAIAENQKIYDALPDDIKALGDADTFSKTSKTTESLMSPKTSPGSVPLQTEVTGPTGTKISDVVITESPEPLKFGDVDPDTVDVVVDDPSSFEKITSKAKKLYGTVESGKEILTELGLIDEGDEWEQPYQTYVADNYIPLYDSANNDWTQQGYQGMPQSGIGNANYLDSVLSAFQTNPYYLWMANNYQRKS
tara:strand:+ start:307 stop:1206 length:900 start_codon:yes stop_codon:yes gene_type:complete